MKKIILMIMLVTFITSCSVKPIIDSRGGSGNIPHNAERQHDDLYTCEAIAKDNTNALWETSKKIYNLSRIRLLNITPKAPDNYKLLRFFLLSNDGHSNRYAKHEYQRKCPKLKMLYQQVWLWCNVMLA